MLIFAATFLVFLGHSFARWFLRLLGILTKVFPQRPVPDLCKGWPVCRHGWPDQTVSRDQLCDQEVPMVRPSHAGPREAQAAGWVGLQRHQAGRHVVRRGAGPGTGEVCLDKEYLMSSLFLDQWNLYWYSKRDCWWPPEQWHLYIPWHAPSEYK